MKPLSSKLIRAMSDNAIIIVQHCVLFYQLLYTILFGTHCFKFKANIEITFSILEIRQFSVAI